MPQVNDTGGRPRDEMTVLIEDIVEGYRGTHEGNIPQAEWVMDTLHELYADVVDRWFREKHDVILRSMAVGKTLANLRRKIKSAVSRGVRQGDWSGVSPLDVMVGRHYIPGVGWRTIGKMTGPDNRRLAGFYQRLYTSNHQSYLFHTAVADRMVKKGDEALVEDVFKPDELVTLLRSTTGSDYLASPKEMIKQAEEDTERGI